MGFSIVQGSGQLIWADILDSETVYVGAIVGLDDGTPANTSEGVRPLPVAAGASNTTNKDMPLGVVVGTNNKNPLYNSTYKTDYITDATPHDSTTEFALHGSSQYAMGDRVARVQVALIGPETVLRGQLFDGAVGTGPTVLTATSGDASGLTVTTNATQTAPIADVSTIYCRSGANAGMYRHIDTTSTTVHAWDKPAYKDTVTGDVFVIANGIRMFGASRMQLDSEAVYIDLEAAITADYFMINVIRLDLSVANKEYCEFRFNGDNFCYGRT